MADYKKLFDLIGDVSRHRYRLAESYFAAMGLNHTEARLITLLTQAGGMSAQDVLSNQLLIDRSNAGRALQKLEKQGYIQRQPSQNDKRTNQVSLTTKGQATAKEIERIAKQMATAFFAPLNQDDARHLLSVLEKLMAGQAVATSF